MHKLFVTSIIVTVILGGLLIFQASRGNTSTVLTPSDLIPKSISETLPRIRVGGRVSAEAIQYKTSPRTELRFSIYAPNSEIQKPVPVIYHGLRPDMFTPGKDILIDGEFRGGVIYASRLLTQCPSKYEPQSPAGMQNKTDPK